MLRSLLLPASLLLGAIAPAVGLMPDRTPAPSSCGASPDLCFTGAADPDPPRLAVDPPANPPAPAAPKADPLPVPGKVAPELEPNLGWINTDKPLRLSAELKGHIVVLDFWTYCCINCMHILPDLAALEEQFKNDPVVVIGVHSAKFDNENDRTAIRAAMRRYDIHHPIVVDKLFGIWRRYGAKAWPSFVVIGADGKLVPIPGPVEDELVASGEAAAKALKVAVKNALDEARAAGTLAKAPFKPVLDANVPSPTGLAFPGKVLAVPGTSAVPGALFIADSTNNRIVHATLPDQRGRSTLIAVYGSREPGLVDGPPEKARFHDPQGLALDPVRAILYVADTRNHAIRSINLKTRATELIVGNGTQRRDHTSGKLGTEQPLNSPWDLAISPDGGALYVAMAGSHQLWNVALPSRAANILAGSGDENLVDAAASVARLAQPSGLALSADGSRVYFADSEVSSVRFLNFKNNQVRTVIGGGLFEFGDVDGPFPDARLQHPLGIAFWPRPPGQGGGAPDRLLVADTYNHKIKLVEVGAESSQAWIGVGRPAPETKPSALVLDEPGGLSLIREVGPPARDWLFIADTNNHRIVRVNADDKSWAEVRIDGLAEHDAPAPANTELK